MLRRSGGYFRRPSGLTELIPTRPAVVDGLRVPAHTLAWRRGSGPVTVQGDDALWMEVML